MNQPARTPATSAAALVWPPGYRIEPRATGPTIDLVHAFQGLPTAAIGDVTGRSIGAIGLHRYHARMETVVCGPAVTVRVRPGDNLMIHKALTMVRPGDVLVVDGGGDLTQALVGGLIRTTCVARGLAALVIDGAVRDLVEWAADGMPIWARGHTHRGPSKDGPGEINVPVSVAGLVVQPGDLVVADADGVTAVPARDAAPVLERARAHLEREARVRAENAAGTSDPERFDAILRARGLPV